MKNRLLLIIALLSASLLLGACTSSQLSENQRPVVKDTKKDDRVPKSENWYQFNELGFERPDGYEFDDSNGIRIYDNDYYIGIGFVEDAGWPNTGTLINDGKTFFTKLTEPIDDASLMENGRSKIGGIEALKIRYTYLDKPGVRAYVSCYAFVNEKGDLYTISFASKNENVEECENKCCSIIGSLEYNGVPVFDNSVADTQDNDNQEQEEVKTSKAELDMKGEQIYNNNGLIISIADYKQDTYEFDLKLQLENTSDEDMDLMPFLYGINGFTLGSNEMGLNSVSLPTNKKTMVNLHYDYEQILEEDTPIYELEFVFWNYAESMKAWDTGEIIFKTNIYDESKMPESGGDQIYSDDVVELKYFGFTNNYALFMIENKSDYIAYYRFENASVSGWAYEITDYTYDVYDKPILPHSYRTVMFPISEDYLKDFGIDSITDIEFNITLSDASWDLHGDWWKHTTEKISVSVG